MTMILATGRCICNHQKHLFLDVKFTHEGHVYIMPFSFSRHFIILYGPMWTDDFCRNGEYDLKNIQR